MKVSKILDGLKVRQQVFDTYWYFAYERLMMMCRRIDGEDVLTDDPILSHYKFCNTYRICDRVSQYLVRDVQNDQKWSKEDLVLRTILFRLFSWPVTWETIGGMDLSTSNFNLTEIDAIIDERMDRGEKVYTSAFILSGTKVFGGGRKHHNHLKLVQKMIYADKLTDKLIAAKSLKEVYELLICYPMVGRFLAYQLAIDLNYSTVIDFDESSFVVAGPGAERGIKKCFDTIGDNSLEDVIMYMVDTQDEHFERLGLEFPGLYGRKLQAIDCQGLFCETDKYSRVKFPELVSNRIRIKTKYMPRGSTDTLFFPPKWHI